MIILSRIFIFLLGIVFVSLGCNSEATRTAEFVDGKWIEYYPSGRVKSSESVQNNLKNGEALYYSEDGKLVERGEYLNDKVSGCWVTYYPGGAIKSFNEYFRNDSLDRSGASNYPNRFVDFDSEGNPDFSEMTFYYNFYPVDTLGEHYYLLELKYLIKGTKTRMIFAHGDSLGFDTCGEEENPMAIRLKSKNDYIYGMVESIGDTVWTDGKWGYQIFTSYFDSREPPCNIGDFQK